MPGKLRFITIAALLVLATQLICACSQLPGTPEPTPVTTIAPIETPTDAPVVQIVIHPDDPGYLIPADFLGLSYDISRLTGNYFRQDNQELINLIQNLGNGVLTFGANGLDYTYWSRTPSSTLSFPNAVAVLAPSDLDNLFAFAGKAGWQVILGLNLGANNPQMAADMAAYAAGSAGNSLLAFEIGNEPDLYYRNGHRSPDYTYEDYLQEFQAYLNAIREQVPDAPIAGPVTASKFQWFSDFLKDEGSNIVLATNHHYPLNADPDVSPTDPTYASIDNLLSAATTQRSADLARQYATAASSHNIPVRFDETNSSYPPEDGLGDTLASALWGVDYLFNLAERGVSGANFFGGFEPGGYTPLYRVNDQYYAQPLYYGMLLFHTAAVGRVVPVDVSTALNVTAHATLSDDGQLRLVIINKEAQQTVNSRISVNAAYDQANAVRLLGSSLEAENGITLAGSSVKADGTWSPLQSEPVPFNGSTCQVVVPAGSAVEITFK